MNPLGLQEQWALVLFWIGVVVGALAVADWIGLVWERRHRNRADDTASTYDLPAWGGDPELFDHERDAVSVPGDEYP